MISRDQVLSAGLQACRLYRIYVWDPRTDYTTQTLGYIGETLRLPFTRWLEHVYEQPWADTIAALVVDEQVFPSKGAVLAAEEAAVRAERPLFNIEFNMGNPDRIKPWEAKEQALERQRRALTCPHAASTRCCRRRTLRRRTSRLWPCRTSSGSNAAAKWSPTRTK